MGCDIRSLARVQNADFVFLLRLTGYVNSCPICRSEGVEKTAEAAAEEEETPAARRRSALRRRLFESTTAPDGNVPPLPAILRALLGGPNAAGLASAAAQNAAPGVRWRGPVPAVVGPVQGGLGVMAGSQGNGDSVGLMFWLG